MGCGKSFWGKRLAAKLNYNFIDLDLIIEQQENVTIATIFIEKGESYFREIENKILLQTIFSITQNTIVATGGGTPCFYDAIDDMNNAGATIFLNQSIEKIIEQISNKKNKRPLLRNVTQIELEAYLQDLLEQRIGVYGKCKFTLSSKEITQKNLLKTILINV